MSLNWRIIATTYGLTIGLFYIIYLPDKVSKVTYAIYLEKQIKIHFKTSFSEKIQETISKSVLRNRDHRKPHSITSLMFMELPFLLLKASSTTEVLLQRITYLVYSIN